MSRPEKTPPPVGDRIHLPGPSVQPALIALGLALALMGLIGLWFLSVIGVVLLVVVVISWIAGAAREYRDLPARHD
ncbi:MAG: hypothetical protein ACKOB9_08425 [Solirubrobacterales bacterium]